MKDLEIKSTMGKKETQRQILKKVNLITRQRHHYLQKI
jgi:hypothetical protein